MKHMPFSTSVPLIHHCNTESQILISQETSAAESNSCVLGPENPTKS